ncbi:MAG TPA: sulfite exporter TauE/SafE family protein, partial [Nitrososphaeraceae archaeon]|nr:sulfite exporter TauE/SafE family protein [Nitrososphaeraceae archaeon]
VPIMLIMRGMNMYEAAPSSQFIILISAVTGLVIHIIMGHPNYVYGLSLAAGAFVGGAIGSELLGHIREGLLRIFLSISLLFVSTRLIFGVIDDL